MQLSTRKVTSTKGRELGRCFVWLAVFSSTSVQVPLDASRMRLRPTTRDIIVLLIILLGILLFLAQFEFAFQSSNVSGAVYQLGTGLKLAHIRPNYAGYEGETAPPSSEHGRENQTFSTRVRWETGEALKTAILAHTPGMSPCSVFLTLTHHFQAGRFLTDSTSIKEPCILSQTTRRVYHPFMRSPPLDIQSSKDQKRCSTVFRPTNTFK